MDVAACLPSCFLPQHLVDRAVRLTTFPTPGSFQDPLERMAAACRIARVLATAELVVTRRLHIALPAASFGTPVVAIPDPSISEARRRFAGFDTFVPTVFLDRIREGLRSIDWHQVPTAAIPPDLLNRHAAFVHLLTQSGLAAAPSPIPTPDLDRPEREILRLSNPVGVNARARLRLRIADRVFDRPIHQATKDVIDIRLPGFHGLSKLRLEVEVQPEGRSEWIPCGPLRDLARTAQEVATRRRAQPHPKPTTQPSPGPSATDTPPETRKPDPALAAFVAQLSEFLSTTSVLQMDWPTEAEIHLTAFSPDGAITASPRTLHLDPRQRRLPLADGSVDTVFNLASLGRLNPAALTHWLGEIHRLSARNVWFAVENQPDRDQHWWESRFQTAGFRRHRLAQCLLPAEAGESPNPTLTLLFEKDNTPEPFHAPG